MAAAISDAGVNIAAVTCVGPGERAELHILVPHAEAAKHALAISHLAVTREREVVVVEAQDRPGVLADLARKIAKAGINLDLVYVATQNRIVFGSDDQLHDLCRQRFPSWEGVARRYIELTKGGAE